MRTLVALVSLSTVALLACAGNCEIRTRAGITPTSATCSKTSSGMRIEVVGDACTFGSSTSCSFSLKDKVVTFVVMGQHCSSGTAQSTGCAEARASCDGPLLPEGTYDVAATNKLTVAPNATCTFR